MYTGHYNILRMYIGMSVQAEIWHLWIEAVENRIKRSCE